MFFLRRKTFSCDKRKEDIQTAGQIFMGNIISELCIKNNVMIMFMQAEKYLYECLITCQSEKTYI